MKAKLFVIFFVTAAMLGSSSCVCYGPPPQRPVRTRVWVPAHWERTPRGSVWVCGHYERY